MSKVTSITIAIVLLIGFGLTVFYFFSKNKEDDKNVSALELVQFYAKNKGRYLGEGLQEKNDFNVNVGPIFFRYSYERNELLASGYVASGQVALINKNGGSEIWNDYLVAVSKLQPTTLAGGDLELYTGDLDPIVKKPAVYLTKKYVGDFPKKDDFIQEMKLLARWSTYWRDERWNEVFSARSKEDLKKEALEAEVWAQKQ
jgi:hypothetical protein